MSVTGPATEIAATGTRSGERTGLATPTTPGNVSQRSMATDSVRTVGELPLEHATPVRGRGRSSRSQRTDSSSVNARTALPSAVVTEGTRIPARDGTGRNRPRTEITESMSRPSWTATFRCSPVALNSSASTGSAATLRRRGVLARAPSSKSLRPITTPSSVRVRYRCRMRSPTSRETVDFGMPVARASWVIVVEPCDSRTVSRMARIRSSTDTGSSLRADRMSAVSVEFERAASVPRVDAAMVPLSGTWPLRGTVSRRREGV